MVNMAYDNARRGRIITKTPAETEVVCRTAISLTRGTLEGHQLANPWAHRLKRELRNDYESKLLDDRIGYTSKVLHSQRYIAGIVSTWAA
jgi:hypothetical protein